LLLVEVDQETSERCRVGLQQQQQQQALLLLLLLLLQELLLLACEAGVETLET
jgi:predicted nucleic acid-binding Zn ribbon protein